MPREQELPESPPIWHAEVAEHNLTNKTIHNADLVSASNIGYEQFLLLRVLWKTYEDPREIHRKLELHQWVTRATEMLAGNSSWSTYCDSFGPAKNLAEGTFAIARYYQLEVVETKAEADPIVFHTPIANRTRARTQQQLQMKMSNLHLETPTRKKSSATSALLVDSPIAPTTPEGLFSLDDDEPTPFKPVSPMPRELENILYPPTKDEQIVNTALIVFLNALTLHFSLSSKWTLHRRAFTAEFETAQFEARTDGYLDDYRGKPSVLIEVKPVVRSRKLSLIQMQESAQMVAWIKSDDEVSQRRRKTRLHISQDRHHIYVTVAKYSEDYLAYLNNKRSSGPDKSPSFLTMHQFGPWNTLSASHMRELGPILLAISLRADQESKSA